LDFSLDLLSLHIWDEEWWNQIFDDNLWLVLLLLHIVQELVDCLDL
jgi:hypothetical protein